MRKILIAVSLLVLAVSCATAEPITVTSVSSDLLYNSHVGNEWSTSVQIDGKQVQAGEILTVTGSMLVVCSATENDKIPDIGQQTKTIPLSTLKPGDNTIVLDVIVTENRGRYSGNTAKWRFTIVISK